VTGRTAYLCDFDGTISPRDIGAAFVKRFSSGHEAARTALLERWMAGAMGHRELTIAECEIVSVHEEEALAFTRTFDLDPHFAGFARMALERGDRVMVVSEGFEFYLADHLARAGLGDLPFAANRVVFRAGRIVPEFPHSAGGCGACGNCKAQHVRRWAAEGFRTVLVGDGFSDRCGARVADAVLARGSLLEWCAQEGIPATSFQDFADVAAWARPRDGSLSG
jgi:HAD superfamily phosphoserine phosphatase-like hydrolase